MKTIIEPFRAKVVEPIQFKTREERQELLEKAGYNLFQLRAEDVTIDLLTDSGTSAMSSEQWSALMRGDESYAGASSYFRFEEAVKKTFGFDQVIPVHQGRAAERILFSELVKPGQIVPSNTHFDTTRANIEARGARAIDLPSREWRESDESASFAGNIDLELLNDLLNDSPAGSIPFVLMTITNNACGGQPVSLENMISTRRLAERFGVPIVIDAARFAENAYLIQQREHGCATKSVRRIARELFECAAAALMSCKKDGLANIGGFIALRDAKLAERLKTELILTEGFPTYGGLTGRDLETIATGLNEVVNEDYLAYRAASARFLARGLIREGVPIISPPGLHAIYVDAGKLLPHIEPRNLPGQALACRMYLDAGIRSCEIGTAMFGSGKDDKEITAQRELVRLALPRRVYSQSHYEYVIEAFSNAGKHDDISGMRIVWQAPRLRHFTAIYEPLAQSAPVEERMLYEI